MTLPIQIKRLDPRAKIPVRATEGSAGYDIGALLDAPLTLLPGERTMIPTGLAIALPSNEYVALIYPRSGLAIRHGIGFPNSVGVIDSDYRGELRVGVHNLSDSPYTIEPGERIAQLIIAPVPAIEFIEAEELGETARSSGGFGSTGRR